MVNVLVEEEEVDDIQIDASEDEDEDGQSGCESFSDGDESDSDQSDDESLATDGSCRTGLLDVSEVIRANPDIFSAYGDEEIEPEEFNEWELFDIPWAN